MIKTVPDSTRDSMCLLVRFGGKKPEKPYQTVPAIYKIAGSGTILVRGVVVFIISYL